MTDYARARSRITALRDRLSDNETWALVDQMVVSIANFAMMLILARILGPQDFGVFSLVFTTLMFTLMLQRSLIGTPHNVIGPRRDTVDYRDFTRSAAALQVGLITMLSVVLLLAALVVGSQFNWSTKILLLMIPMTASYLWTEFIRRVLYTEARFMQSALNSLMLACLQLGMLIALLVIDLSASVSLVLMVLIVSACIVGTYATVIARSSLSGKVRRAYVREILDFGSWLGGSTLITGVANQAYLYSIAAVLSPAAVGTLRTADTLVRPIGIIANFLESTLPAALSRLLHAAGPSALHHRMNSMAAWFCVTGIGSIVILALWGNALVRLLFGPEYASFRWLPAIYGILYLGNGLGSIVSSGIRSFQYGKVLFSISVWVTLLTIPASLLLMAYLGVYGAALGLVLPALVRLLVLSFVAVRRINWKPALTLG